MSSDIAQRKVLESWRKGKVAIERPKLSVLHSIHANLPQHRSHVCWCAIKRLYRRVLMHLRGGTAHFHIETGPWIQIPREL